MVERWTEEQLAHVEQTASSSRDRGSANVILLLVREVRLLQAEKQQLLERAAVTAAATNDRPLYCPQCGKPGERVPLTLFGKCVECLQIERILAEARLPGDV